MKKFIPYLASVLLLSGLIHSAQAQTSSGGVGIGTSTPDASALLDLTSGSKGLLAPRLMQIQRLTIASPAQGLLVYQTDAAQPGFWYYSGSSWTFLNPGDNLGSHSATQNLNLASYQLVGQGGSAGLSVSSSGSVGIGTSTPQATLHVAGTLQVDNGVIQRGGSPITGASDLGLYSRLQGQYMRFVTNQAPIRFYSDDNVGTRVNVTIEPTGNVGIGTDKPSFPLDVQSSATPANFTYGFLGPRGSTGMTTGTGPVSIRTVGRVVAAEFDATSDARLKSIIGQSSAAADLSLLQRLRITDYTMRDRAQYGNRLFKKVIAQEVEQVFPQAVNQHLGFLPDVYQLAARAEAQGDSLLRLTLPTALPVAAQAGQRLKLVGPAGEVVATVRASSGTTLLVRGAQQLAGQQVFVFGLEHADVRTVDYEALAMLNVSATQELTRQLAALQQQNATLQAQTQADHAALRQQQAALQAQAGQQATLAQRLTALESVLNAQASVK